MNFTVEINECDGVKIIVIDETDPGTIMECQVYSFHGDLIYESASRICENGFRIPTNVLTDYTGEYVIIITPMNPSGVGEASNVSFSLAKECKIWLYLSVCRL